MLQSFPGAFVPITMDGTLIVDGVFVSCYTSFSHNIAHNVLAPIRWFPWLFETEESQHKEGVRTYAKILKYIGKTILPSNHYSQNDDDTILKHSKTASALDTVAEFLKLLAVAI